MLPLSTPRHQVYLSITRDRWGRHGAKPNLERAYHGTDGGRMHWQYGAICASGQASIKLINFTLM